MALFEQFPYTNFHEMNMDWLLRAVKSLSKEVDNIIQQGDDGYFFVNIWYDSDSSSYKSDVLMKDIIKAVAEGKHVACKYNGIKYYDSVVVGTMPQSCTFFCMSIDAITNSSADLTFTKFVITSSVQATTYTVTV